MPYVQGKLQGALDRRAPGSPWICAKPHLSLLNLLRYDSALRLGARSQWGIQMEIKRNGTQSSTKGPDEVAEGYRAMDERRAIKTLLRT
jgi:hypothetical protein